MRTLAIALLSFAAVGTAAAADLPVKARPMPMVMASTWTGAYAGINLGYGVGQDNTVDTTTAGEGIPGFLAATGSQLYGGPRQLDLAPRGFVGGAQIGYNWQMSPVTVFGVEADFQGADMKRAANCVVACNSLTPINSNPASLLFPVTFSDNSVSTKLDWFGTVRARAGYTTGPTLFYVTGGFAYGDVERRGSVAGSTSFIGIFPVNTFAGSFSNKSTETGWTVGGGVEGKLWGNWSVKAEYLYIDLGKVTDSFNTVFLTGGATGSVAATRTITTDVREHIFRVGLNYQFGQMGQMAYR
jgi:outer membrane immunogenic protein